MSAVPDDMDLPPKPDGVTNGQLYLLLQRIHSKQLVQTAALAVLERDFADYKQKHEDMVRTWSAAKTMMGFIKLMGGVAVALGALYGLARLVISHFIPGTAP